MDAVKVHSMTPDALIFDLDGLLIDTEVLSQRAFDTTAAEFDIGDRTDLFLSLVGTNEAHHNLRLQEELGDLIDITRFRKNWNAHFAQLLTAEKIELLPGVRETLVYANEAGIKCAVATSSGSKAADKKIADAGISEFFLSVTCGDQVKVSKPHPEIFQKASKSVNADISRSVGLEDSANGVRAAHAAGLHVVQIPNLVPPTDELLSIGHRVCSSMHEALGLLKKDKLISHE